MSDAVASRAIFFSISVSGLWKVVIWPYTGRHFAGNLVVPAPRRAASMRDDPFMEEIGFFVESSLGDLEIRLTSDGWTRVEFRDPGDDPVIIEDIVRNEADLAAELQELGIPEGEAVELAQELWEELDEEERRERAEVPGPRRS